MSIVKNLKIKINNDKAKISEDIYVYQNDRGIELRFKLSTGITNYRSNIYKSFSNSPTILAAATILKPNGELMGMKKSAVIDDTICFMIDKDFTDNVDEIGVYKVQFHLYDTEDNRITIPPVEFEVKELLGLINEDDLGFKHGIVDSTLSDLCIVGDNSEEVEIFSNGKYIKTIWNYGDLITSVKLNKIEEAIEYLDNKFHIGNEPLCNPMIWIDVPDLNNSNLIMDNTFNRTNPKPTSLNNETDFLNIKDLNYIEFCTLDTNTEVNKNLPNRNKEQCLPYGIDIKLLLEALNNTENKLKVLEKEV